MKCFISATDTNIGKTLISTWLCYHLHACYFKPIQAGTNELTDSQFVKQFINHKLVLPESYVLNTPCSPHLSAQFDNISINLDKIKLPNYQTKHLIIEGAGGLLVPLNNNDTILNLIQKLDLPTILVTNPKLGTINHTLLSIQALQIAKVKILGFIMNGDDNKLNNVEQIIKFTRVPLLAKIPTLNNIKEIKNLKLTNDLFKIFQ